MKCTFRIFVSLGSTKDEAFWSGKLGLLFQRWLPDGDKDALVLHDDPKRGLLSVSTSRKLTKEDGLFRFDGQHGTWVSDEGMKHQALLNTGSPLVGKLQIDLDEEEIQVLKDNKTDAQEYLDLGKKIVNCFEPEISDFLGILRTNFGQYWIDERDRDRTNSVEPGLLCYENQIQWSLDEKHWERFRPEYEDIVLSAYLHSFDGYLTKDDWASVGRLVREGYRPDLAVNLYGEFRKYCDDRNFPHAVIVAATALELAIEQFLKKKYGLAKDSKAFVDGLLNCSLPTRIVSICSGAPSVSAEDVDKVIGLVKTRNDVVHEGKRDFAIEGDTEESFRIIMSFLIGGPELRNVSATPGNQFDGP